MKVHSVQENVKTQQAGGPRCKKSLKSGDENKLLHFSETKAATDVSEDVKKFSERK